MVTTLQQAAGNAATTRALRGRGSTSVQRATGQTGSPDPAVSAAERAELTFDAHKKQLWGRINQVHALSNLGGFRSAISSFLQDIRSDVQLAMSGGNKTTPVDSKAIDAIIEGLQHPHVLGHQLQYRWYVRNQDKEGFYDVLSKRGKSAAEHGAVWSKMGAAEAIEQAQVTRAVVLESSIQGYIFNDLLFGLPNWGASPTLGALWQKLSATYSSGLQGWVTAHVLEGRDSRSVLATIEWPELQKRIGAGDVHGMNVIVYKPELDEQGKVYNLTPVTTHQVTNDEQFAAIPAVPGDQAYSKRQTAIDGQQKKRLTNEVESRESQLDELSASLHKMASALGTDKEQFRFRLSKTPNSSPHATMDAGTESTL